MKTRDSISGTALGAGLLAILSCGAIAEEPATIQYPIESAAVNIAELPDDTVTLMEWNITNYLDFPLKVEKFDQSCGFLSVKMNLQGAVDAPGIHILLARPDSPPGPCNWNHPSHPEN